MHVQNRKEISKMFLHMCDVINSLYYLSTVYVKKGPGENEVIR